MAPFRASRSTRSGRPGAQSDVDYIDGLPVRQWRLQEFFIGPSSADADQGPGNANPQNEKRILPNGRPELALPQGSNYYTPWCLQILKAARSGRLGKRKERDEEHEDEKENGEQDEAAEAPKMGFAARKWGMLPRHLEEPERVYLAKRREGLPKQGAISNQTVGPNGEMVANGAPVEEPVRRRMPPPRRKPKKGPGRKKKMTEGDGAGVSASAEAIEGPQQDGAHVNGDVQQGADGAADKNEEGEVEDEDSEEGEEGEIADDDHEEGEVVENNEEERKLLREKFKGGADQKQETPAEMNGDANGAHEKEAVNEKIEPVDEAPVPKTALEGEKVSKEDGEMDVDADEEEYEPPPPKEDEEDEVYEPPPPKEPPAVSEPPKAELAAEPITEAT